MFFITVIKTNRNDNYQNLYKTTTRLRRLMLSPLRQIPIQSLLYKTTTCLTRSATTFLSPKWKKLSKTVTEKLYPVEKWEAMHKKYTSLWLYVLYCYFIMQSLFDIYKNCTFTFNIRLPNYSSGQSAGFPIQEPWVHNR